MKRNEMIEFIKSNPGVHITHDLFDDGEFIYSKEDGLVYDENGNLFEDWCNYYGKYYCHNGIRIREGNKWEDGWRIKQ